MTRIDFTSKPGDYTYSQSQYGKSASGVVKMGATSARNNTAQRTVGGSDREPDDHGGHLIAHSAGGRNDETNMDPQNKNVNQIGQRSVERDIANLANDPNKTVFMDVQNYNSNGSQRPDATMMTVAVQDNSTGQIDVQHYSFQNASYEDQDKWNAVVNEDAQIDPRQDLGMTPEQRELANEYAEESYDIGLGEGYAVFFDQDTAPITAQTASSMDDGVSLGVSETSADSSLDMDDGVSLDSSETSVDSSLDLDDGASLGSDAGCGDSMDSSQDGGMSNE